MKLLSHILILLTASLVTAFAFSLTTVLPLALIYATGFLTLEAVKYTGINLFKKQTTYANKVAVGALTAALIAFSGYSSYNVVHQYTQEQFQKESIEYQSKKVQYEEKTFKWEQFQSQKEQLQKDINILSASINNELQRGDRNGITDSRIRQDRDALQVLKNEYQALDMDKPAADFREPQETASFVPGMIALLIEASAVFINFFRREKPEKTETKSETKSEVKAETKTPIESEPVSEPVESKVKPVKTVKQPVKPNPKPTKPFKSVKDTLQLNDAQRMRLKRELTRTGRDWKTFNEDKNNLAEAKQFLELK